MKMWTFLLYHALSNVRRGLEKAGLGNLGSSLLPFPVSLTECCLACRLVFFPPRFFELIRERSHASSGEEGVEVRELGWEDGKLQDRFPEEGEVGFPAPSLVVVGAPGGIECVDNQVRSESRKKLDNRDP